MRLSACSRHPSFTNLPAKRAITSGWDRSARGRDFMRDQTFFSSPMPSRLSIEARRVISWSFCSGKTFFERRTGSMLSMVSASSRFSASTDFLRRNTGSPLYFSEREPSTLPQSS